MNYRRHFPSCFLIVSPNTFNWCHDRRMNNIFSSCISVHHVMIYNPITVRLFHRMKLT